MARTVDLRGRLGMADNPVVKTDFGDLTVNDRAFKLLQVASFMQSGEQTMEAVMEAASQLFAPKSYELVRKSDLSLDGLMALMESAMDLAMGGTGEPGDESGNAETPATT